jgi:hypothetical protein
LRACAAPPADDGLETGILRDVLAEAAHRGFAIDDVATQTLGPRAEPAGQDHPDSGSGRPLVQVTLHVHGRQPVTGLAAALSELEDVDDCWPLFAS